MSPAIGARVVFLKIIQYTYAEALTGADVAFTTNAKPHGINTLVVLEK